MKNRRFYLHHLGVFLVIALGTVLRFWNLDLKPLWLDEIMTAIFSSGKNYQDFLLGIVFSPEQLQKLFTFQGGKTCGDIAQTVAVQSTHPPLFFCVMYSWLELTIHNGQNWVSTLRTLPALFGVGSIIGVYFVNRIAFGATEGLVAAAVMAVSPFAVYLSQEARHYTMPMLLVTLALIGLMQIQQSLEKYSRIRFWVWVEWAIINSIGIYVHYFFVLPFVAQIITIALLIYWRRDKIKHQRAIWLSLIVSTSSVVISFLPWLPIMLSHFHRSETDWLSPPQHIVPFFNTLINSLLMVISLPVENQPLPITIISGLLMLVFGIWVSRQIFRGLKQLWQTPKTHLSTFTLLTFLAVVQIEVFLVVYLLAKNITIVPRYNFIYYPSACALIAASLIQVKRFKINKIHINSVIIVLLVGFISSVFVVNNLAFQKPFLPERVAQRMNIEPQVPLMVVMAYSNYQEIALGLSFALELKKIRDTTQFVFFKKEPNVVSIREKISRLQPLTTPKLNLWIVGPGIAREEFIPKIAFSPQNYCTIDPQQYYVLGAPYQMYRCN
ncbi:MAG: glycosyltransferase family 39 protein [Scytonematopsis contorta HA4267-MV1]|jgi:uncharacterized membrane protein|nr:glycosyltransferase family 39 protein [Scytonematopsis contorta HA4267-MV1]